MQYDLVFKDSSSRKLNNLQVSIRDNGHTYLLCCTFKHILSKCGLYIQDPLFVSKHFKEIASFDNTLFLETTNKKITFGNFLFVDNKKKELEAYQKYLSLQKNKCYQANIYSEEMNLKIKKCVDFSDKNLFRLNKSAEDKINIEDSGITFKKYIRKYSFDILENLSLNTNLIGMYLEEALSIQSDNKKALINQDRVSLSKSSNNLYNDKNGRFVQNNNKRILIDQNDISLFKSYSNLNKKDYSYSLNKKMVNMKYVNNSIGISKKVIDLKYVNPLLMVKDGYKNTSYSGDLININTAFKNVAFIKNLFVDTNNIPIRVLDLITINDCYKRIFIEGNEWISDMNKKVYLYDTIQIDKSPIDVYMEYKETKVDIRSKGIYLNDLLGISKGKAYKIDVNAIFRLEQYSRNVSLNEYLSRDYRDRNIALNEMVRVETTHKDVTKETTFQNANIDYLRKDVHLNRYKKPSFRDNFEFVTVIQGPWEDFDEEGGVDELLLPHKDHNYTHFLKEMINEDGTIKPEYITGYDHDKMQYRVKLPIENPVQIYNLLGREYLDLDVGFLSYFMTVLKARWRDKMYTYAAMNSLDAITDILEYLHHFFYTKYSKDEEKLAYTDRCLQLFRWYSEMAILNNSEYQLEFATKKIQVDYYNKTLNDFENMVIMNNMQISDNFILEPIDMTLPCNIIFVNTKKDIMPKLKLHFKLYNVNNQSSILIIDNDNNVTETNYNSGIHELDLELENKIEIKFEPTDINQTIAITSTDISNMPTRNFTLRYCGRVGDVNPILKEVCNMLLIDSEPEISDDNKKIVEDIAPATAAIYQMVRYYDMHHREKKKGKRLTIKK